MGGSAKPSPSARAAHFGPFGGIFVPETLMAPLGEVAEAYESARADPEFQSELERYLRDYVGRPTALYPCRRLAEQCGGAKIYLKREDLAHTGSHKLNNVIGQGLLARRMGRKKLMAETGAGQHGVATATVAALFGMECDIYMGEEDVRRQALNVYRMRLLGARVIPITSGSRTLKDAINEAFRVWMATAETTYYLFGTAAGPHPYPTMVRDFQSVVGREAREQMLAHEGRLPDYLVACVGGGSNAIGLFHAFLEDDVRMVGVEAAGRGLATGEHAASLTAGSEGVLHGARSKILQTAEGQIRTTHSIAAGLDYPGVGPEHAHLQAVGRATYVGVTDSEALQAFDALTRLEGIMPALESAHAVAHAMELAAELSGDHIVLVNLSGRGDKDIAEVQRVLAEREK
ncbi:MAG: tryptophan synthase subunit beta [Armatimonadota bacterium]|nr:MAG: tryptophan synthase subunit beta [Armatimonadota bacterium]